MSNQLQGQWIVVTGASSGIGAAAAGAFAGQGCQLVLGARRTDRLEAVAKSCRENGAQAVHIHPLDVSQADSVNVFAQWIQSHTSKIDVLVNNAGGAHGLDPIAEGSEADWETMLQVNVLGLALMTKALLPLLKSATGASIINIGSITGRTAYEGGAMYCGAKAAELQISRALRLELCGTGIRVSSIDPGMVQTEFSEVRFKGDRERAARVYEGMVPLTARDIAESIVWVASRPPHVCVDELLIKPTDQAAIHKVHRQQQIT